MKLTILCDNHTITDRYFLGEPGLSFYIEDGEITILFDLGYSDLFIKNAEAMGINLLDTDYIVFSHGHLDHTWGLSHLLALYSRAKHEGIPHKKPVFVSHPAAWYSRTLAPAGEIGSLIRPEMVSQFGTVVMSEEPYQLTDTITFLGKIPKHAAFEPGRAIGTLHTPQGDIPDIIPDDSSLLYTNPDGIVLICGCTHAGICSTIDHAFSITGIAPVLAIIGGLHLHDADESRITATCEFLRTIAPKAIYPCHCTGLAATIALASVAPVFETGVGYKLQIS